MRYIIFAGKDGEGIRRLTPIIFPDWIDPATIEEMMRTLDADGVETPKVVSGGEAYIHSVSCSDDSAFPYTVVSGVLDSNRIMSHNRGGR